MKTPKLSCLYYPTTCVLVDDDKFFLNSISLKLDPHIPYKTYLDPKEALNNLQNLKSQNQFLSDIVAANPDSEEYAQDQYLVSLKVSNIYHQAYNRNLFNEVSVVIVDYAMPQMNGAELLKNLSDIPIKKIMLTGQADESFAVQLFNDGIIDKFILKKDTQTLAEMINRSINELQDKYFHDHSEVILQSLPPQLNTCFNDPIFIELFNKIKDEFAASSYYLLDTSGSFIFFNDDAVPAWLIVKTADEVKEFSQQAEVEGAPEDILGLLKKGEKIAYFNNFDEYVDAINGHWNKYLFSAKTLNGKNQYYYAVIKNIPSFPLQRDKILSFNTYLNSNSSE